MIIKRHHVTLIELLLVLFILALVSGVVGLNIRRAFIEQKFRAEVSEVVDSLRLAQDLMLVLNSDVHVKFASDPAGGGIQHWIEVEKKLATNWERELVRKKRLLQAIHLIEPLERVEESEVSGPSTPGVLDIKFLSGGLVMTKGNFGLFSSQDRHQPSILVSTICLPGYPRAIESLIGYHPEACVDPKEKETLELTTRDMVSEIQPKWQKLTEGVKP